MKRGKIKYIMKNIGFLLMIASISIVLYQLFTELKKDSGEQEVYGTRLSASEDIPDMPDMPDISSIIEKSSLSVVGISKIKDAGSAALLFDSSESLGLGSGIILSAKGYILTNQHVAGEIGGKCYITTEKGETITGKVVWSNEDIDLAIMKADTLFDSKATLGDSNSLRVGQSVYAIGNPIGLAFQRTVTSGIISAVNRTIKIKNEDKSYSYMSNLIQTDATINPGNSGGPLIDGEGKVIGINTIKITSAEGIGFAIPINIVKPIIEKFEAYGEFNEAYLGMYAYDSSIVSYLRQQNLSYKGVYIESIIEDGPASMTQLQKGDQIIKIDTTNIAKMSELQEYIFQKNPGDEIMVTIVRNQQEMEIKMILGKKEKR